MKSLTLVAALALVVPVGGAIAESAPDKMATREEKSAVAFTTQFLKAFENLDLDAFMACFASNATVFFPAPEPPGRFDGKPTIREHFAKVFSAIRETSKSTAPPYHQLPTQHLSVQVLTPSSAVVTFELVNDQRFARRTLVLVSTQKGWLIQHLHASSVPAQR